MAILLNPEPHNRESYTLHGPIEQNHHDIAKTLSATLGFPVHYEPTTLDDRLRHRRPVLHSGRSAG